MYHKLKYQINEKNIKIYFYTKKLEKFTVKNYDKI
jgi:hypothetical protein